MMTGRVEHLAEGVTLYAGDCLERLKELEPNSVDACVCDPPYGLGFMGKAWDHGVPGIPYWKQVLRVLKPGAFCLAFGGDRMVHRLAVAIEDAGMEIRGQVAWIFGSGFPKSLNVSKQIDKQLGGAREQVRVPAAFVRNPKANGGGRDGMEGATRPWIEEALERGYHEKDGDEPITDAARQWDGWGTALKPAMELVILARKPLSESTVAANVLKWGTSALNIDGCRVATGDDLNGGTYSAGSDVKREDASSYYLRGGIGEYKQPPGRWPANVVHDGSNEVVEAFPESDHARGNTSETFGGGGMYGHPKIRMAANAGDCGSAARFFYTAKADADDRLGSRHPTVKPLDLMQYLVRLVGRKGALILDPFAGTGTTGEAAFREGMRAILIEREAEYQDDIRRRMRLATCGPAERSREGMKAKLVGKTVDMGPLFSGAPEVEGGGSVRPTSGSIGCQANTANGQDHRPDLAQVVSE